MQIGKEPLNLYKKILEKEGVNPNDYLYVKSTADNIQFVHKTTEKILDVRR
jgi:hypothetical protein